MPNLKPRSEQHERERGKKEKQNLVRGFPGFSDSLAQELPGWRIRRGLGAESGEDQVLFHTPSGNLRFDKAGVVETDGGTVKAIWERYDAKNERGKITLEVRRHAEIILRTNFKRLWPEHAEDDRQTPLHVFPEQHARWMVIREDLLGSQAGKRAFPQTSVTAAYVPGGALDSVELNFLLDSMRVDLDSMRVDEHGEGQSSWTRGSPLSLFQAQLKDESLVLTEKLAPQAQTMLSRQYLADCPEASVIVQRNVITELTQARMRRKIGVVLLRTLQKYPRYPSR